MGEIQGPGRLHAAPGFLLPETLMSDDPANSGTAAHLEHIAADMAEIRAFMAESRGFFMRVAQVEVRVEGLGRNHDGALNRIGERLNAVEQRQTTVITELGRHAQDLAALPLLRSTVEAHGISLASSGVIVGQSSKLIDKLMMMGLSAVAGGGAALAVQKLMGP